MIRRLLIGLMFILCLNLITGCKDNIGDKQVNDNQELRKALTRGDLFEDFGITDEDLEGIEFETIVEVRNLGRTSFGSVQNKEQAILLLKGAQEELDKDRLRILNDKTYILNAAEFTGDMPDLKELKYLSIEHDAFGDDADKVSRFIDFDKKILYVNTAQSIVADLNLAFIQVELEDAILTTFISDIKALGISKWEQNYDSDGRDKYMVWDMGLEFKNGQIISYHGTLNDDGGYPETYRDLIEMFQGIEKEAE